MINIFYWHIQIINKIQLNVGAKVAQDSIKWIWACVLLLGFLSFLIIKANGILDFTGKYGIESIRCEELHNNNCVMMLDGDLGTTWGLTEKHVPGEQIVFQFRKQRKVSEYSIINNSEAETIPVKIYYSNDNYEWVLCKGQWLVEKQLSKFVIVNDISCKYLMIENNGEKEGVWPITEVEFEG